MCGQQKGQTEVKTDKKKIVFFFQKGKDKTRNKAGLTRQARDGWHICHCPISPNIANVLEGILREGMLLSRAIMLLN